MATGLMSCVRENSPPLEMATSQTGNDSGALSLPLSAASLTTNTSEQPTKRRRFHPLRNLRKIFRRRTLTNSDAPNQIPSVSTPQHTSNPMTQQILNEKTIPNLTLSSPSSPSSHYNLLIKSPTASTTTGTVPAHLSKTDVTMLTSGYMPSSNLNTQQNIGAGSNISIAIENSERRSPNCGIQVIPSSNNRNSNINTAAANYYLKMKNNISKNGNEDEEDGMDTAEDNSSNNRETITDNQRSFSEGRLVDDDLSRDGLSQSRDSVFSESATASSLSIVLKNELFDVLRRRNRPDASDEDLGLPNSPRTPQHGKEPIQNISTLSANHNTNLQQSEISSLSLLSMASSDLEDELSSSHVNESNHYDDKFSTSISSSKYSTSFEISRASDEIDLSNSSIGSGRLSHSAAKHKMAVRPIKKKGPTRHKRPIEASILPSTPEVNEELIKISSLDVKDLNSDKIKSRSLPHGVNPKAIEYHNDNASNIKRSKTEKGPSPNSTYSKRNIIKSSTYEKDLQAECPDKSDEDYGFFRRFLHRNSKKNKNTLSPSRDETDRDMETHDSTISNPTTTQKTHEYSQKVEETRKEIRREILSEANSGLSLMLNNFILPSTETDSASDTRSVTSIISPSASLVGKIQKPKSGPAARQRIIPKDLSNSVECSTDKNSSNDLIANEKKQNHCESSETSSLSAPKGILKSSNEHLSTSFQSNKIEFTKLPLRYKSSTEELSKSSTEEIVNSVIRDNEKSTIHFEKQKPKIVGLSPFQQRITRAEALEGGVPSPILPKQRKSVEKSKSFRYEEQNRENDSKLKKYDNMPSLPDLSFCRKSPFEMLNQEEEQSVSLGFEINDNNLMNSRNDESLPLSHGIFTKNIILTTSKSSKSINKNINEIEDSIDKLISQPLISAALMKKSTSIGESLENKSVSMRKSETFDSKPVKKNDISSLKSNFEPIKYEPKESRKTFNFVEQNKSMTEISKSCESVVEMRNKAMSHEPSTHNSQMKARRSSSISERTTEDSMKVPEFMKIQLNRVPDPTRPKSNIILSKNLKDHDVKLAPKKEAARSSVYMSTKEDTRRYSNESVEISDNKPPLPPLPQEFKRSSLNVASIETNNSVKKQKELQSSQDILHPHETNLDVSKERRKSVTDEKLKYEKKIEEITKIEHVKVERKKSIDSLDSRKDCDLNNVVLRKKDSSKKDDPTPELMKVFARRSLKIKDEELQNFEEISNSEKIPESDSNLKKFTPNLDSDKENQSSSEEKLDKLPKVEITIQGQQQQTNIKPKYSQAYASQTGKQVISPKSQAQIALSTKSQLHKSQQLSTQSNKTDETNQKSRTSLVDLRRGNYNQNNNNSNNNNNNNNNNNINNNNNNNNNNHNQINNTNNINSSASKQSNRYNNNIVNYRNTSPSINSLLNSTNKINVADQMKPNINEQNNNNINNIVSKKTAVRNTMDVVSINENNLNDNDNSVITETGNEFKGILQRRAEWEKRAKEASK